MTNLDELAFSQLRAQFEQHIRYYYPDSYRDFSAEEPGAIVTDLIALSAEMLAFYGARQFTETLITKAQEEENIYSTAQLMGYKPRVSKAAVVNLIFRQTVPAYNDGTSWVPDTSYCIRIPALTSITGPSGVTFLTEDEVDFKFNSKVTVWEKNSSNVPTRFLLTKEVSAFSATIKEISVVVGTGTPYYQTIIEDDSILGIESVIDAQSNKWWEVNVMGEDKIFEFIKNDGVYYPNLVTDQSSVPYLLKGRNVSRRFTSRVISSNKVRLEFGNSNVTDSQLTDQILSGNWQWGNTSPLTYGMVPQNTTLTIRYFVGGGVNANVRSFELNEIDPNAIQTPAQLNSQQTSNLLATLSVENPEPARGGDAGDSLEDIRTLTLQLMGKNWAVTPQQLSSHIMQLPPRLGSVGSVHTQIENGIWCVYVIGKDENGNFSEASNALKQNIKKYIDELLPQQVIVSIRDAIVINIGLDISVQRTRNNTNPALLLNVSNAIQNWIRSNVSKIGQPFDIASLEDYLDSIDGVQMTKISPRLINDTGYSQVEYEVKSAVRDGLLYPSLDPSLFEIKNLLTDIRINQI